MHSRTPAGGNRTPLALMAAIFVVGMLVGGFMASTLAASAWLAYELWGDDSPDWHRAPSPPRWTSLPDRLARRPVDEDPGPRRYALLINSDDAPRHVRNIRLAHEALVSNGYPPENIFALSWQATGGPQAHTLEEEGGSHRMESPGSRSDFLTHAPTFGNVQTFFEQFARAHIHADDELFVYTTGHGYRKGRVPVVLVSADYENYEADLSSLELNALLEGIQPARAIFVFDQCHAGFEDVFSMDNYLCVSRARLTEEGTCYHWAKAFFEALTREDGDPPASIQQAFDTALERDPGYRAGTHTPTLSGPLAEEAGEVFLGTGPS